MGELISFSLGKEKVKAIRDERLYPHLPRITDRKEENPKWIRRGRFRILVNPMIRMLSWDPPLLHRVVSEKIIALYPAASLRAVREKMQEEKVIKDVIGPKPATSVEDDFKSSDRNKRLHAMKTMTEYVDRRSAYLRQRSASSHA